MKKPIKGMNLAKIEKALLALQAQISLQNGTISSLDKELPALKHAAYGAFKAVDELRNRYDLRMAIARHKSGSR